MNGWLKINSYLTHTCGFVEPAPRNAVLERLWAKFQALLMGKWEQVLVFSLPGCRMVLQDQCPTAKECVLSAVSQILKVVKYFDF